jgi:hypothetical protein
LLGYAKEHSPETAVIMLSGISDPEYVRGLTRMGAFDYLQKPFLLDDILRSVNNALGQRRPAEDEVAAPADSCAKVDEEEEDATVFSALRLGGIFSLAELLDIAQRGRMTGYFELHWDGETARPRGWPIQRRVRGSGRRGLELRRVDLPARRPHHRRRGGRG